MTPEPTLEQCIKKHLPPTRRVLLHIAILAAAAYLIGPYLGPLLFDPQSTWGRGQAAKIGNILNWGTFFFLVELMFYTAWIIKQGRKGHDEYQMRQWRKTMEGEAEGE